MWLRASIASIDAGVREGSELDRGASAGNAMGLTAQLRIIVAERDDSARMRLGEGRAAAQPVWMHCC